MISTSKPDQALTLALKVIAKALRNSEDYSSYRLRRVRYNMLRNRGIRTSMTYPRVNKDIVSFVHVRPVVIRHLNHMNGAGIAPPMQETFAPVVRGRARKLRSVTA